jgi:hypothetical protein
MHDLLIEKLDVYFEVFNFVGEHLDENVVIELIFVKLLH